MYDFNVDIWLDGEHIKKIERVTAGSKAAARAQIKRKLEITAVYL
jgi:hypothetical protein